MPRLADPLKWLENNARPSWKITLTLSPCHYETDAVEPTHYDITYEEIGKIHLLITDYEMDLPELGEKLGIDYYSKANQTVTIRIPRRNGGHTVFDCWYDNDMSTWVSNKNLDTGNPKDKVITFQEAMAKLTKTARKVAPKKSRATRKR